MPLIIISVAAQTDPALAWWWSPRAPKPLPYPRRAGPDIRVLAKNDPVVLIARYRHALLLGLSDTLAAQWWGEGYDWRKAEAEINKLPQYTRDIDVEGFETLNIHYVHQKSEVDTAIPLLFLHGCKF